jgi:hypothetical protein
MGLEYDRTSFGIAVLIFVEEYFVVCTVSGTSVSNYPSEDIMPNSG